MRLLASLEQCHLADQCALLLYVDRATPGSKFVANNEALLEQLHEYQRTRALECFASVTVEIAPNNVGPYRGCYNAMESAYGISDRVIFSEDDIVFCRDTLQFFVAYFDYLLPTLPDTCLGIASTSRFFPFLRKESLTVDLAAGTIAPVEALQGKIADLRSRCHAEWRDLFWRCEFVHWAPNKQFAMTRENWNRIRHFRSGELNVCGDSATGQFVNANRLSFLYSFIPRANDIGLYNEQGCTTLYYQGVANPQTIKTITSNDLDLVFAEHPLEANGRGFPGVTETYVD